MTIVRGTAATATFTTTGQRSIRRVPGLWAIARIPHLPTFRVPIHALNISGTGLLLARDHASAVLVDRDSRWLRALDQAQLHPIRRPLLPCGVPEADHGAQHQQAALCDSIQSVQAGR